MKKIEYMHIKNILHSNIMDVMEYIDDKVCKEVKCSVLEASIKFYNEVLDEIEGCVGSECNQEDCVE